MRLVLADPIQQTAAGLIALAAPRVLSASGIRMRDRIMILQRSHPARPPTAEHQRQIPNRRQYIKRTVTPHSPMLTLASLIGLRWDTCNERS